MSSSDGDEDHAGGGELGQLAPAAGAVHHLRLGGAAVDHERAGERGRGVGRAQAGQVVGDAERLGVLGGVGPRGRRALGQDDHEHGRGGAEQRGGVGTAECRQPEGGQAARDRAHHGHAVGSEVEGPAHG